MDVYSVDTNALRALKKPSARSEEIRQQTSEEKIINSPPRIPADELIRLQKALEESLRPSEEKSELPQRESPLSFRLSGEYLKKFLEIKGKGNGSKIKELIKFYDESNKVFATQTQQLLSLVEQIDRQLNTSKTPDKARGLAGLDTEVIKKLCREVVLVCRLIRFNHLLHGRHLNESQLRTIKFAHSYLSE